MALRKSNPPGASVSPAYSHVVEAHAGQRTVFISGQIGTRPDGTVPEGVAEQAELVFDKIGQALASVSLDMGDVAKITVFLTDETLLGTYRAVAARYLPQPPPASSLVFVKALILPGLLVEIDAIAFG